MRYISVCSGIEAATTAWHGMGWEPVAFAEIEPFPSAVLKHHWPDVPNLKDFTTIGDEYAGSVDLLIGGTPCQAFSLAGKRCGLDDPRGNLAIEFLRLARRLRATWVVWENVPGVLSSNKGRDFGAFIRLLEECGYGWAYRTLDAQYFGVPQRRQRIFVVGHIRGWQCPAAVLFERNCFERTRKNTLPECSGSRIFPVFNTGMPEGTRRDIQSRHTIRMLTPLEYERATGFPDNHTRIPWRGKPAEECPDGPRYKAIGNSMAVPVMRWIGERIQMVDNMTPAAPGDKGE